MSNYSQITAFTPKDSLSTGNPAKVIKGSDFDAEFAAISTAIISKADAVDLSNVDNTSDLNKPISTATQTALDAKVAGPASSTDNTLPRFDGTTGKLLQGSGVYIDDTDRLGVGRTPTFTVDAYQPGTANSAVVASNDTVVVLLSVSGTTQANMGTVSSHDLAVIVGNSEKARFYQGGNFLAFSGLIGYGAGAGGTVTQATSKSTAVTLNKPSGKITMHNASLAANTSVLFTFSNSFIGSTDMIDVQLDASGISDTSNYQVWASAGSGAAVVVLRNVSGGSLSESVGIRFAIKKVSQT